MNNLYRSLFLFVFALPLLFSAPEAAGQSVPASAVRQSRTDDGPVRPASPAKQSYQVSPAESPAASAPQQDVYAAVPQDDRKKRKNQRSQKSGQSSTGSRNAPASSGSRASAPKKFKYPNSTRKARYRIDVLANLYLNEMMPAGQTTFSGKVADKAQPGLAFYEGIALAADTLDAQGYALDVYIHDVSTQNAFDALLRSDTLAGTDLIIGALQSAQLPRIADYAKAAQINFISTLSPSDAGITDNPYFIMLPPTLQSHCVKVRKHAAANSRGQDVILLHYTGGSTGDEAAFGVLNAAEGGRFAVVASDAVADSAALAEKLDRTVVNQIVVPVLELADAQKVLSMLRNSFSDYRFHVYGMPSWQSMPFIKKADSMTNMTVTVTEPFYYDPTTGAAQGLIARYDAAFRGRVSEMVFRGYEVLMWYGYLLEKYGTIFNERLSDNAAAPFNRFDINTVKTDDGGIRYLENQQLNMIHYERGVFRVEY